jgi:hypothetical protein
LEDVEAGVEIARRMGSSELVRGLVNLAVVAADLGDFMRSFEVHEEFEAGDVEGTRAVVEELLSRDDPNVGWPYAPHPHWLVVLAAVAGKEPVLELVRPMAPSPWRVASIATVEGDYAAAADIYGRRGIVEAEAFQRLRLAEQLIEGGNRAEADVQLRSALAFYRSVGATRYIQEAEALLRESA